MRRAPHRSPRGLRFSVSLALSHGGPDGGSLRFTARKAELKTKGPNFVSKWKQVRYTTKDRNVSHLLCVGRCHYEKYDLLA